MKLKLNSVPGLPMPARRLRRISIGVAWFGLPTLLATAAGLAMAQPPAASAGAPVIYPAKGQSPAQIDQDKYACFEWGKAQSGHDPMQPAPAEAGASPGPARTAAQADPAASMTGMVKGAAGGAAVAELTKGDTGKGAAIGVLGAAVRDRVKQQHANQQASQQIAQQQQQQLAQAQSAQSAHAQQRATFERAFGACLEGRGYVVKKGAITR